MKRDLIICAPCVIMSIVVGCGDASTVDQEVFVPSQTATQVSENPTVLLATISPEPCATSLPAVPIRDNQDLAVDIRAYLDCCIVVDRPPCIGRR